MSTLTDRLRGIVGGAVPRRGADLQPPDPEPVPAEGTATSGRLSASAVSAAAAALGGRVLPQSSGAVVVVDRHYAPTDRHGRTPVSDITATLQDGGPALAVLAGGRPGPDGVRRAARVPETHEPATGPAPPDGHPRPADNLWFLDLETTGLAGGAGTQAFLVGCAYLDAGGISVRQFLLPGYEHEPALLAEVAAWAAARGAIVTFNGKSFDVPLIETRYLFHRVPFPLEGAAHVDMLHPARRLWRARGTALGSEEASCSLGTLERLLAGVHRVGDVPGFEIPSRYFQFVRDGDARPLEAVLEHNRIDLVSLALVLARAVALIERGPAASRDPYECLGLARLYDRAGRIDAADAAYERAIAQLMRVGRDPDTSGDALRRLAWCRRRAGRRHEAAEAWQRLVDLPRCPAALRREAREALAIHQEHRVRDLDAAHAQAEQLLTEQVDGRWREAAERRLRRIERKLQERETTAGLWPER